ncbi:MAG TPA: hypothetical protein PK649_03515 [Vicingus sp.]|nr:hypothetical protein [Vicingus sp.]HRP59850.1 hypothetical protein [Vicingus sp.]
MAIFFLWIFFCFIVGFIGSGRNIGYWGVFFISLFLSPLIGLIFGLASRRLTERELKGFDKYERLILIMDKNHLKRKIIMWQ